MVNPKNPECNGPFLVYDIPDMKCVDGTADECRGFYIILPSDNRFTELDDEMNWYSARVTADGKKLQFKVPGWPFALFPKLRHSTFLYNAIVAQVSGNVAKSMNHVHSFFDDSDNDLSNAAVLESRK